MTHWFDDFDHGILSPSGHVSKRARKATEAKLRQNIMDAIAALPQPKQPSKKANLLRQAAELRVLAARGMCIRKYPKMAAEMEAYAATLSDG